VSPVDGLLLVDKPEGETSTRSLAVARRALGIRKAGHTGTLDPFATGLLPLAMGEATKFSRFLLDADKSYQARLRLGAISTTGDTEGEISEVGRFCGDIAEVERVLSGLVGEQTQVPPMHSAVRVDGKRLYDLAREGIIIERAPRKIAIKSIECLELSPNFLEFSVTCSKGTYVRTLGEEIGRRLGCGGYLTALRRTAIGRFRVDDSITPSQLVEMGQEAARERLLPAEVLVESLDRIDVGDRDAWAFCNGQVIGASGPAGGEVALFGPGGRFLGVAREAGGRLAPCRLMATGHG